MSDEELLAEIQDLVKKVGRARILSALTGKGVSATTAERIAYGRYSSKPIGMLRNVLLELLNNDKAS